MREVEFIIDGVTVRGFQWWSNRTIPATLEGMTEERARQLVADELAAEALRDVLPHPYDPFKIPSKKASPY